MIRAIFATVMLLAISVGPTHAQLVNRWIAELKANPVTSACFTDSDDDGRVIGNDQWKLVDGQYQVLSSSGWVSVPTDAIIGKDITINVSGWARIWWKGETVRCFMPARVD